MAHTKGLKITAAIAAVILAGVAAWAASSGKKPSESQVAEATQSAPADGKTAAAEPASTPESAAPLADIVLGDPAAPLEVIEYASMTCGACAHFHTSVVKDFKTDYVNTGKARYILRHFVANGADIAASMIARCGGGDDPQRYFAYIDMFLSRQPSWIAGWQAMGQPRADATLADLAVEAKMDLFIRPTGMARNKMQACLADDQLQAGLLHMRTVGVQQYGVDRTPTIFINGKRYNGPLEYAPFEEALKKAL